MVYTEFEKYCENCDELEPEVDKSVSKNINGEKIVNSTIRCKHRQRCKSIMDLLRGEWWSMKYDKTVGCVDIHIDTSRIDNNIRNAQKVLNMQVVADCDEYIPMQQGALRGSVN